MNSDELYILKIINDLTWNEVARKYTDQGREKVNSFELENITDFDKVKIRLLLMKLQKKKLISNSNKFTGAKAGWFATPKGHNVAIYKTYKKEVYKE